MTIDFLHWQMLWWAIVCICTGLNVGKMIDIQYHEPEGKPMLISIPEHLKIFFHFRYLGGNEVVIEGVITQIIGYIGALLELILFALVEIFNLGITFVRISDLIIILYPFILVLLLLPMHIRYNRNLQQAYDCDWITQLQEILTLYPKRRCKIVSITDASTCVITLGQWGRRSYIAKTAIPISVGSRLFAVHSSEHGAPFWTILEH